MTNPTKTDYKVLCYGNNNIPSSEFSDFYTKRSEKARNFPSRISLYYAPDLDLFNRFEDPVYTPEVRELIEQGEIDVFLILISLDHVMSSDMYELLTSIPTQLGFSEESFWPKSVIAFSMKECSDPKQAKEYIRLSIDGNNGVKWMFEKVRERYTYLSDSEPDTFLRNFMTHYQNLGNPNEVVDVTRSLRSVEARQDEITHPTAESWWRYLQRYLVSVKDKLWRKLNTPLVYFSLATGLFILLRTNFFHNEVPS